MLVTKKVLISMGVVFVCMPCLFGNSENIKINGSSITSEKVYSKTKISSDIERPLLRSVVVKKEDIIANDQKTVESSTNSRKKQDEENILSLLRAEREKLRELEKEYNQLEGDEVKKESDDAKNYEVEKVESMHTSVGNYRMPSLGISATSGTSTVTSEKYPKKDKDTKAGSLTAQLSTIKDNKKPKGYIDDTSDRQLEKVIRNASSLDIADCYYKLCEYDNALQMYKLLTPDNSFSDQYIWAQYQIANCYRNMKKFDIAFSEYQRFVNQYPDNDLVDQAKWYIDDINWWKSWYEKNNNNQLLTVSNSRESK